MYPGHGTLGPRRDLGDGPPWTTCEGNADLVPLWTMEGDTIVVIHSDPGALPAMFDEVVPWAGCNVPEAPSADVCYCGCP